MPPADFWNLAGRAGRVEQGQVGIVALVAPDDARAERLSSFVSRQVASLNSTLTEMVAGAMREFGGINLGQLSYRDEWSAFVQFLAHTYRQIDDAGVFAMEVERLLRGTFGFQDLRAEQPAWANELVRAVRSYAERLGGQPLSLVDATGFSWESVSATMGRLAAERIGPGVWSADLYTPSGREDLARVIGVMLQVPELREELIDAAGSTRAPGRFVARVVSDWVAGRPIPDIAEEYFRRQGDSTLTALTRCCQRLFRSIAPTVAWGMSAMQAISMRGVFDDLPLHEQRELRNLPSYAFYGVDTEPAVTLRLLGVPRAAAAPLSRILGLSHGRESGAGPSVGEVRRILR
ncbi:MAG TPA: hypothetical protein VGO75_06545, partial [Gemmatimonadaceae bacterium]|nr:hypothetical protein [Gemmatimonadaceae bacterium]